MAKRLEESLYRSAKSFEEYNDASTLKQRLQQLAHNIGMKTKKMQEAYQYQQQQQQVPVVAPAPLQIPAPGDGQQPGNGAGARQVSDRQQVLRHQQQRLLLLRHAAKCQHEDGRCPVTPHCAGMKRLWKHIAECKDQKCLVLHCVSSRYVLSHYHRCKDVRCPVCGPVREVIHRSHEKQKQT